MIKIEDERNLHLRFIVIARSRQELDPKVCNGEFEFGVVPRSFFLLMVAFSTHMIRYQYFITWKTWSKFLTIQKKEKEKNKGKKRRRRGRRSQQRHDTSRCHDFFWWKSRPPPSPLIHSSGNTGVEKDSSSDKDHDLHQNTEANMSMPPLLTFQALRT